MYFCYIIFSLLFFLSTLVSKTHLYKEIVIILIDNYYGK